MQALSEEYTLSQLEQQLEVGKSFLSKGQCHETILALFFKRGEPHLVKVGKSDTTRVSYKCTEKGCNVKISIRLAKRTDRWTVKSCVLQHSCKPIGATSLHS